MTSPLANAILKTGIIDEEVLNEIRKWGLFTQLTEPVEALPPSSVDEVVFALEAALQSPEMVSEKVTDVDAIRTYLTTRKTGTLCVHIGDQSAAFDVPYGKNELGEYILPWQGENLADEITNGLTHLLPNPDNLEEKIFFNNVRELYYGDHKAFIACTPSPPIPVV